MITVKQCNLKLYFILIFFSGFSFLIFEVSWFRLLSLAIGSTTSASSLVLSAFLSGMGLGAFVIGKKIISFKLELLFGIISTSGLLVYSSIVYGIPFLYSLFDAAWVGYLFAIFVVFIPAFFMGGVLPIIAEKMVIISKNKNKHLGLLYALETLGSFIGAIFTGFILIKWLGQYNTVLIASAVLAILALYQFIWGKKETSSVIHKNEIAANVIENQFNKKEKSSSNLVKIILLSAFTCGFLGVSLQVIWFRFFNVYFVNTSYTFATISAIVILGLFIGSWFYSIFARKIYNKIRALSITLLFISISSVLGIIVLLFLPELIMIPLATTQDDYLLRIFIIPIITAVIVIVPTTAFSGFCFPLLWSMATENNKQISSTIGKLLFFNSMGSAIGPILITFLFIPLFGAILSSVIPVLLLLLVLLFIHKNRPEKSFKIFLSGSLILLILVLIVRPQLQILPPSFSKYDKKVIGYGETSEGTYIVGQELNPENPTISTYVNNSSVIGSTYDAIKAVKMVGHLPFLMGLNCNNALVVGFGIGVTTSAIASHQEVKNIDCVEIIPELKNVAFHYKELNRGVYNDPRLKINKGDGRHFLQSTHKQYELISSDPTHPILGSGNIYTKEYFELCKAHLSPHGMISQYLPLHKLRLSDFLGIIKTFKTVFPDATLWLGQYHAILIASKSGKSIPIDFNRWKFEVEKLPNDPYFYSNAYHLAASMALNSIQIDEISNDAIVNTDDKSYVEFFSLDAFMTNNLPNNLSFLNQHRGGVNAAFVNIDNPSLMSTYIYSNQILTDGLVEMLKGNDSEYKNALEKAHSANPENQEYPFLLKLHFIK